MNSLLEIILLCVSLIMLFFSKKHFSVQDEDTQNETADTLAKNEKVVISVEKIKDNYYAWNSGQFIFQTERVDELIEELKSKYPKNNIVFVVENEEVLSTFRAKL